MSQNPDERRALRPASAGGTVKPAAAAHPRTTALLERWQALVWRFAALVLAATLAGCLLAVRFITAELGINTDTEGMISETLPWRATYLAYKREFPLFADTITVVVDAPTADQSRDGALRLAEHLAREPALFEWVYLPRLSAFFRRNGLLFLDTVELERLVDELARMQPVLSRLQGDPSLRGLFGLLGEAANEYTRGGELADSEALQAIATTVQANLEAGGDRVQRLSWHELLRGEAGGGERRTIIQVKPRLDFTRLLPGERAVERIRALARELELTAATGFAVRQTGGAALGYEELHSVSEGARKAGFAAMVMVAAVLLAGLRSAWLVLATLATLAVGLIMTAAFAAWAIGELNMISVAFAVLYIGLGVDFAIHYCLRYRELGSQTDKRTALARTSGHIGGSLVVCAVTTALGFFAFVPTAYAGVAELGLISGTGMFIGLAVSLTVLPALLRFLPAPRRRDPGRAQSAGWHDFPRRHARPVLAAALGLAVLAALLLPRARFDHNPIHLHDPQAESVRTYHDLLAESERSPLSISALAPDAATARAWRDALAELPSVHAAATLEDMVPENQEEKLAIIEDMKLILGGAGRRPEPPPGSGAVQAALERLRGRLEAAVAAQPQNEREQPVHAALVALEAALGALEQRLQRLDPAGREVLLERMREALIANLPGRLEALDNSLEARRISRATLPAPVRERWLSGGGLLRVEVWPEQNLDDNGALERFVREVRSVVGDAATGAPVLNVEASAAVLDAFTQAFSYALVATVVVIWVLLRSFRNVLLVLAPLLLAAALTGATTVLLGMPFNFANIIALPLLLGIGVDGAVHMLHRQRTHPAPAGRVLSTSTARGVVFSALTTSCGFGNLALSSHAGTASMGALLTIGVACTLATTLLVLPALMATRPFAGGTAAP